MLVIVVVVLDEHVVILELVVLGVRPEVDLVTTDGGELQQPTLGGLLHNGDVV